MKRLFSAAMFAVIFCGNLISNPVYPGPSFLTASSLEGEILSSGNEKGYGARTGISLEGLPFKGFQNSLHFGYRWLKNGNGIVPMPNAGISSGYRFPVKALFSVVPFAGSDFNAVFQNGTVFPVVDITAGLCVLVRLANRDYFTLTPAFSIPLSSSLSPRFSLSIGTRAETPWLRPLSEVTPRIQTAQALFSPDADGIEDTATFFLWVSNPKSIKDWTVSVLSPDGTAFTKFTGNGKPPESIIWDGTSASGKESEPAFDYKIIFETSDKLLRKQRDETAITVDILVIRDGDHYKIRVPDIRFPSDSFALSENESESLLEENRATLERIATLFIRFPGYSLTVEGHANSVNWKDPKQYQREQDEELLPLSKMRAETVKQALVMLGVNESRIRVVGIGGTRPLVPFSESESIWKNRRVEFILSK